MLVYDHSPGELLKMYTKNLIPSAAISKSMGAFMLNSPDKKLTVSPSFFADIQDEFGGRMSDFSSWGTTPDLKIKPEITAPGGNIYSAYLRDGYKTLSGTSMASPHIAAAVSLIKARIAKDFASAIPESERTSRIEQFMMSTAVPQKDENGNYYSPRKQGAGLINLASALKSKVIIEGSSQTRPKMEVGESASGTWELSFKVKSFDSAKQSFTAEPVVMTEDIVSVDGKDYIAQSPRVLSSDEYSVSAIPDISLEPNGEQTIKFTLSLTDKGKSALEKFPNGIYVDGFIRLKPKDIENQVPLSIPFLGFYGSWNKAPVLDKDIYSGEAPAIFATFLGYVKYSSGSEYRPLHILGYNGFLKKG